MRIWVRSQALLTELRIQSRCKLQCRWQMWLGSVVAQELPRGCSGMPSPLQVHGMDGCMLLSLTSAMHVQFPDLTHTFHLLVTFKSLLYGNSKIRPDQSLLNSNEKSNPQIDHIHL